MMHILQSSHYARELRGCSGYKPSMLLRIKELRQARGLTQQQLADKAGLERSQLSKIENGREPANTRRLNDIATALGVSAAELFSHDEADAYRASILSIFDSLDPEQREAVIAHARALVAMRKGKV